MKNEVQRKSGYNIVCFARDSHELAVKPECWTPAVPPSHATPSGLESHRRLGGSSYPRHGRGLATGVRFLLPLVNSGLPLPEESSDARSESRSGVPRAEA
jgi:hypothetical protein